MADIKAWPELTLRRRAGSFKSLSGHGGKKILSSGVTKHLTASWRGKGRVGKWGREEWGSGGGEGGRETMETAALSDALDDVFIKASQPH